MGKKSRYYQFILFVSVFVLVLSLVGCGPTVGKSFPVIGSEQVEQITVWVQSTENRLNRIDADKFIQHYNNSEYRDIETHREDNTSVFGATIHFYDGSVLCVNESQCIDHDFIVTLYKPNGKTDTCCYISNTSLLKYLSEMVIPT